MEVLIAQCTIAAARSNKQKSLATIGSTTHTAVKRTQEKTSWFFSVIITVIIYAAQYCFLSASKQYRWLYASAVGWWMAEKTTHEIIAYGYKQKKMKRFQCNRFVLEQFRLA